MRMNNPINRRKDSFDSCNPCSKNIRVGEIIGTPDKPCGGSVDANPKTCCQTIHDCQKVVPLHYESEWQYKYV